jgi:cytochrome c oxidase subunit 2
VDDRHHEAVARWERRWLALSGLMSLLFVMLIAYTLATEGGHVAQRSGRAAPEILTANALFSEPGVRATGPNTFQVSVLAQAFAFDPAEIRLPVGAEVDLFLTSRDVIHGYQVQNTSINVELIPGEIAALHYTFDKPGEYRVSCNEYCGISHQNMLARIVVMPASQFAQERAAAELVADAQADDSAALAASLYDVSCAVCHQADGDGMAGVFPPLAGHAADLYRADPDYLVQVLLYGLQGPIEVQGASYNGAMQAWRQFGDDQLAALLNHIVALGNDPVASDPPPYAAAAVAAQRGLDLSAADVYQRRQALELGE